MPQKILAISTLIMPSGDSSFVAEAYMEPRWCMDEAWIVYGESMKTPPSLTRCITEYSR